MPHILGQTLIEWTEVLWRAFWHGGNHQNCTEIDAGGAIEYSAGRSEPIIDCDVKESEGENGGRTDDGRQSASKRLAIPT
jgi:hypothetical protein